jgi:Domain of unknown function (DUF6391)
MPNLLAHPGVLHTRRNHALEHATIHLLSARPKRTLLAGHSDMRGFYLLGEVPTAEVEAAVHQALRRLQAGEGRLALHPNCGTSLVTGAVLAGSATFLVSGLSRRRRGSYWLDQLPLSLFASLAGLVLAQPLGLLVQQRVTTEASPGGLQVESVRKIDWPGPTLHRILTVI